jgi:transposase
MPQPIPVATREMIVSCHEKGESLVAIANDLKMSYWTARHIWRRYRDDGPDGLKPGYDRCGPSGPLSDRLIYRAALWLRRRHRSWGAGLIRVLLTKRYGKDRVPTVRSLQRWFKAAGLSVCKSKRPSANKQKARRVPQVWQMDAKERVPLKDGRQVCYLSITDEKSGAHLITQVFPPQAFQ